MIFVLGLVLLAAIVGWPIFRAQQGAREISFNQKLFAIAVVTPLMGLCGMVFGRRIFDCFPSRADANISPMFLLVLAVFVAVGLFAQGQFEKLLESLGYVIER